MEEQPLEHVVHLAQKKQKVFRVSRARFLTRSALASMFIGFGVIVAFKTGSFFYNGHFPLTYPMAAITFGAAIILIAYGAGTCLREIPFILPMPPLEKRSNGEVIRI